jgi:small subunit ribosomal protein S1
LKQLQDDPWAAAAASYAVGQRHPGRVTRVADFGAFVELAPGVEGLAHASTFATRGSKGWDKKSVPIGTTGTFQIMSIDTAQKRIGLSMVDEHAPAPADDDAMPPPPPDVPIGSLADKLRDALGKK